MQSLPWNDHFFLPQPPSFQDPTHCEEPAQQPFFWPQLLEFQLSVPFLAPYLCSMALRRNLPCCANYWWVILPIYCELLEYPLLCIQQGSTFSNLHQIYVCWFELNLQSDIVTAYNNFLPKIKKTLVFTRWICKSPSTVTSYMCGVIWCWGLVREGTTQEQWHAVDVLNLYVNCFYETCTRMCPVFLNVNCGTQQNLSGGLGRPYISVCPGNAGLRGSLDFLFPVPLHHPYTIVG